MSSPPDDLPSDSIHQLLAECPDAAERLLQAMREEGDTNE